MLEYILSQQEYDFIHHHPVLGNNVILLGVSGSIAYGTNHDHSDIDLRGVTLNPKSDLIGMTNFEQYIDRDTDTVIYGFNKFIKLLLENNPSVIELLGLKSENYLVLHPIGRQLIQNASMFLSKRVIQTFGSYANAQLRRIQNALARDSYPQKEKENHILGSLKNAMCHFNERYSAFESGAFRVYLDKSANPKLEQEIFIDANIQHYPLRDYKNILQDMESILRSYDKLGNRNTKKDDYHLNKHAMHLVRLLLMGIDILKTHEIHTRLEEHLPLLLEIKSGKYRTDDGLFKTEFYQIVQRLEDALNGMAEVTNLPDQPDFQAIQAFVMSVNEKVVKNEI